MKFITEGTRMVYYISNNEGEVVRKNVRQKSHPWDWDQYVVDHFLESGFADTYPGLQAWDSELEEGVSFRQAWNWAAGEDEQLVDCPKCGGRGQLPQFDHIDDGKCYECDGTGSVRAEEGDQLALA